MTRRLVTIDWETGERTVRSYDTDTVDAIPPQLRARLEDGLDEIAADHFHGHRQNAAAALLAHLDRRIRDREAYERVCAEKGLLPL